MEKITSFTIDHIKLQPGVYVSRKDPVGNSVITTFDIRMTSPNEEPVMNTAELHTIEHLAATFLRNHREFGPKMIYWGPMGCRTGFYLLLTGDYDCAATRRTTREGEPPVRSWFARMFYRIINKMSDTEIVDGARDFRLMSRRMVDAVLEMSEYNRFSKGIFSWVGFKTKWFAYQNVERVAGQTKWNFWSLFKYSIEGIVGFSTQPLVMAALAGVIFCLAAFVGIIFVVVRALIFGDPTAGWPSMVCIMLLCSGVQLFCLGIVGEYLAKTYLEVKHRPIYITRETEQDRDERKPAQQK